MKCVRLDDDDDDVVNVVDCSLMRHADSVVCLWHAACVFSTLAACFLNRFICCVRCFVVSLFCFRVFDEFSAFHLF